MMPLFYSYSFFFFKQTLNKEVIKGQLKELVWGSVEKMLNKLLEQEAQYERSEERQKGIGADTTIVISPQPPEMPYCMSPD